MENTKAVRQIAIANPGIGEAEKQAVMAVLDSGQIVQGAVVAQLEKNFAEYVHAKHAVASVNGTTALTLALMAHGIGTGDEVLIPSFSFIATATSLLSVGAKPVFVDVERETFCMDVEAVEAAITPRTKAIMPVHLYGHAANIPALKAIAEKHGLVLLEDSAQAHGARYNGHPVGSDGTCAFSFYASKNMTTGEGGMTTTNDDNIAQKMRMMRNHGMNTQYYHEVIGFNYRMTNIAAAIGVAQLEQLEARTEKRIANAKYLTENIKTVRPPITAPNYRHVYHQYTVLVPEGADRDKMVKQVNDKGIGARVYYPIPIHRQPVFQQMGYSNVHLPVTEELTQRVFSLPVHPFLTQEDLEYIVDIVNAL